MQILVGARSGGARGSIGADGEFTGRNGDSVDLPWVAPDNAGGTAHAEHELPGFPVRVACSVGADMRVDAFDETAAQAVATLNQVGYVIADVTEHEDPAAEPRQMVAHNAALKADWVATRHPDALVLGADTTVFIDNRMLNKPANLTEAREMLRRLAGRTHTVYTGVALRRTRDGLQRNEGVASEVTFKAFDDAVIDHYFTLVNPLDKAGAYGIQEGRELIIAEWKGSFSNIMGLSMETTKQILTECGLVR